MRISDWSSDVCSSDLFAAAAELSGAEFGARAAAAQADASREAIASRAALAYIQVLGNEQMLASAQADLGLANDLLTLSRDQQKAGIASGVDRSEEHTSELQSLMRRPYDGFCMKKKNL